MPDTVILLLFATAALSPFLTFAHLWQVKEWRCDRLLDHLRSEGTLRQLCGIVRVPVVAAALLLTSAGILSPEYAAQGSLLLLATLSIVQIVLRRQPQPVWTQKAKMIVGGSALLTLIAGFLLLHLGKAIFLPVLILLQPLSVILVWAALFPLDTFLKRRILNRARLLRKAHPELLVIGVTGSMGKTTSKELIGCVLGNAAIATPTYVNSEIGVARWMTKILASPLPTPHSPFPILVVEMGAYRRGEIALLCSITAPQLGVITAIGTQHVALFGSPEDLLAAKAELIEALPESGRAFINVDSTMAGALRSHAACPVTTVSTGGTSDLEAFDIEETPHGIRFRVGENTFALPLHGTHNVTNVLLAIAVAEHLGVKRSVIAERLSRFSPLTGTFFLEEKFGVAILNDTHNCSPESAAAAIRWAESRHATQKVLLTSGIIEQGSATERVHRDLGKQCIPVFQRVIFLNKKFAQFFAQGYANNVELFSKEINPVKSGTLLVCLGRMPRSTIDRLLPSP
ncbi:hypothetical protein A3C37_01405 [Candidatus Peribacteria bacterium RIFCSPHIGHO2_02_FULL_53_20]|nr:MAG: hypothetical protein A3C37_01405 [Candidatus Peribacteria bacterium RIFCSPHIGHO2_02_FULL_53_20]OGJ67615.1 MAG: hypothetical protein A3B61_02025 [Candidatus Peribacteria bacterium RIFCSPLOWO2_01_FULL_53_10]OGJ74997.1 MAG: hypothetical protein A3G69_00720 [Candidatus Peribacteria bacterium RIFCSPLOWO2_12_FULL_53_10]